MALDIQLKIYTPEKLISDRKVHRVMLPYSGKTLTVIKDRAPTLMPLDVGIVKILDENNNSVEEYFVSDGVADIKENTCTILAEAIINRQDIDLVQAHELIAESSNFFYEWIVRFLENEQKLKK